MEIACRHGALPLLSPRDHESPNAAGQQQSAVANHHSPYCDHIQEDTSNESRFPPTHPLRRSQAVPLKGTPVVP